MGIVASDFDGIDPETYDFDTCRTRLLRDGPYEPHDVVAAILLTHGSFADMSSLLGRRRNAIRDYVFAQPVLKAIFDEVREGLIDRVERSVFSMALGGDGPSQRFILSTVGKHRGYTTRQETTGPDGGPVQYQEIRRVIVDPASNVEEAEPPPEDGDGV